MKLNQMKLQSSLNQINPALGLVSNWIGKCIQLNPNSLKITATWIFRNLSPQWRKLWRIPLMDISEMHLFIVVGNQTVMQNHVHQTISRHENSEQKIEQVKLLLGWEIKYEILTILTKTAPHVSTWKFHYSKISSQNPAQNCSKPNLSWNIRCKQARNPRFDWKDDARRS